MKSSLKISQVRTKLSTWFIKNRRDLPWRQTSDPYLIAVSEVMLQQTQVDRVIPKYLAWRRAWPETSSLAAASLGDVLKLWSGLGYNSRALRLRQAARIVMDRYHGQWPQTVEELESLPGFGPYTARAVASFAYHENVATVDTNIRRILSRVFFGVGDIAEKKIEKIADELLPTNKSATWHATLMDFGSAICTSRNPRCSTCPVQANCLAYPDVLNQSVPKKKLLVRFEHTDRYWRGEIVRQFLDCSPLTAVQLVKKLQQVGQVDKLRIVRLLKDLRMAGLLERNRQGYRISA